MWPEKWMFQTSLMLVEGSIQSTIPWLGLSMSDNQQIHCKENIIKHWSKIDALRSTAKS